MFDNEIFSSNYKCKLELNTKKRDSRGGKTLETHDYFMVALAFLVSTIVMFVVVILWVPGGLTILVFPPFSLLIGFLIAGLVRHYLFSPKS